MAAGAFGGLFDEGKSWFISSRFGSMPVSSSYGKMLFRRTINEVPSAMGNTARHVVKMGAMGGLINNANPGSTFAGAMKSYGMFKYGNKAMAINAGVGAVYGGYTDQNSVAGGAFKGALLGAGAGAAGRAGMYGLRAAADSGRFAKMGLTTQSLRGTYARYADRAAKSGLDAKRYGPGF